MSDVRFNNWKHQSGTGGVTQDGSGNVGIGSTAPPALLTVAGNAQITGIVTFGDPAVTESFMKDSMVGLGTYSTSERDAGIATEKGSMIYADYRIKGKSSKEYVFSTYFCHPSMANDNLSGVLPAAFLGKIILDNGTPDYSWRFVFVFAVYFVRYPFAYLQTESH